MRKFRITIRYPGCRKLTRHVRARDRKHALKQAEVIDAVHSLQHDVRHVEVTEMGV